MSSVLAWRGPGGPLVESRPGWQSAARCGLWLGTILAVGVAVALPEPVMTVVGAAGLVATILALIEPLVALPLLLFAVPFGQLGRSASADGTSATTTPELAVGGAEVIVAVLAAAWLANGVRRRHIALRPGAVVAAIVAMVALALLSIGYALDKSLAVKESLKWLELLIGLLVVVDVARTASRVRLIVGAMFLAGAAEAAYGAVQFATGAGPGQFELQGALRAFGNFDQPNPFAGYLTTMLPLAACMALCSANPRAFRWFCALAAVSIGVGVGLSQSRGAWLGLAVAIVCLFVAWSTFTRRLLVPALLVGALSLAAAVSGLLPAAILDRLAQTIEYFGVFDVRTVQVSIENWAVVERMAHWQAGWFMFLDHPWFGVGAGNYAEAYSSYSVGQWIEPLGHAHNYYINMLAELGLVGGALLLALLGLALRELGGTLVRSEDARRSFWRALLAGVVGGLVVFCVHNLFDSLFVHSVNVQVGILVGLGLLAADHLRQARLPGTAP